MEWKIIIAFAFVFHFIIIIVLIVVVNWFVSFVLCFNSGLKLVHHLFVELHFLLFTFLVWFISFGSFLFGIFLLVLSVGSFCWFFLLVLSVWFFLPVFCSLSLSFYRYSERERERPCVCVFVCRLTVTVGVGVQRCERLSTYEIYRVSVCVSARDRWR